MINTVLFSKFFQDNPLSI